MKLPITWLKKYIDVKLSPEKLAEVLTMSGTAVEKIEKKDGEAVLEIEVTTNRPDCLSVLGLAKEVSALTGKKIRIPSVYNEQSRRGAIHRAPTPSVKVLIDAKKACPKYTARLIQNVTVKESPQEIKNYLEWSGIRSISNVVDATNFVLLEMGQPFHAFDRDKIKDQTIVVRFARKNEKFLGIDGVEYTLDDKTLVIADAEKPVAIAGVMGGKFTEVTAATKNILLESAFFDPALVRQASRKYKLFTDSSYRFERGVDIEKVVPASARARDLIAQWSGGREAGKITDLDFSAKPSKKNILLRFKRMKDVLGMDIPQTRAISILKSLGFSVKRSGKDKVSVAAINSRRDVMQEADLIEEILRIEGFDKVPSVIPVTRHAQNISEDKKAVKIFELKKFLLGLGFNEIITYSFLSQKSLVQSGFEELGRAQKLKNPVSVEHEFLRPTLLPGMLQAILFNVHRKVASIRFFEIGNRTLDGREETVLALAVYGEWEDHWLRKSPAAFFDLKGIAENILGFLNVSGFQWKENEKNQAYDYSSSVQVQNLKFGLNGSLNPWVLKNWDIPRGVFFMEWALEALLTNPDFEKTVRVKPIAKFPLVRRDTAFVIDAAVPVKTLEEIMIQTASPYIKEARLFDEYKGKNIPAGKRSLAFSLAYQKDDGTFTEEEINSLQARVGEALKNKYQVEFR